MHLSGRTPKAIKPCLPGAPVGRLACGEGSVPTEGVTVEVERRVPWHQRPVPTLLVAVVLLAACAGFAVLWLRDNWMFARPAGLVSGALGIYLLTGGIIAVRSRTRRGRTDE